MSSGKESSSWPKVSRNATKYPFKDLENLAKWFHDGASIETHNHLKTNASESPAKFDKEIKGEMTSKDRPSYYTDPYEESSTIPDTASYIKNKASLTKTKSDIVLVTSDVNGLPQDTKVDDSYSIISQKRKRLQTPRRPPINKSKNISNAAESKSATKNEKAKNKSDPSIIKGNKVGPATPKKDPADNHLEGNPTTTKEGGNPLDTKEGNPADTKGGNPADTKGGSGNPTNTMKKTSVTSVKADRKPKSMRQKAMYLLKPSSDRFLSLLKRSKVSQDASSSDDDAGGWGSDDEGITTSRFTKYKADVSRSQSAGYVGRPVSTVSRGR